MRTASKNTQSPVAKRDQQPATEQHTVRRPGDQGGSSANHVRYSGIHNRRDKRYPFRSGRVRPEDLAEAEAYESEHSQPEEGIVEVPDWQEALMLWLSWNSTYEKLTARMCKPGQSKEKIESMMDEMDQLRARALQLSEQLIQQAG